MHTRIPLPVFPQVGLLRFGQAGNRSGESVDPVPGREFLQAHADPEPRAVVLGPVIVRRINTDLPGSLRTSKPPDMVMSMFRSATCELIKRSAKRFRRAEGDVPVRDKRGVPGLANR